MSSQSSGPAAPQQQWDVDAVVIDLDGTLYRGTSAWFAAYVEATAVAADVDPATLRREVTGIIDGQRVLRIGDFYDPVPGVVVHASGWRPISAWTWDGEPTDLPDGIRPDKPLPWDTPLVYVGDAFQAFTAASAHLGVALQARREAFAGIRQRMINEEGTTEPTVSTTALERTFSRARLRVLASNTAAELGQGLVARLESAKFFDEVRFGARKPAGLVELLEEVCARAECPPERVLCVGDSYWNDVWPAVVAGCQAVWVDTHDTGAHDAPARVRSLAELCPEPDPTTAQEE